jgi:hypothetical protein
MQAQRKRSGHSGLGEEDVRNMPKYYIKELRMKQQTRKEQELAKEREDAINNGAATDITRE